MALEELMGHALGERLNVKLLTTIVYVASRIEGRIPEFRHSHALRGRIGRTKCFGKLTVREPDGSIVHRGNVDRVERMIPRRMIPIVLTMNNCVSYGARDGSFPYSAGTWVCGRLERSGHHPPLSPEELQCPIRPTHNHIVHVHWVMNLIRQRTVLGGSPSKQPRAQGHRIDALNLVYVLGRIYTYFMSLEINFLTLQPSRSVLGQTYVFFSNNDITAICPSTQEAFRGSFGGMHDATSIDPSPPTIRSAAKAFPEASVIRDLGNIYLLPYPSLYSSKILLEASSFIDELSSVMPLIGAMNRSLDQAVSTSHAVLDVAEQSLEDVISITEETIHKAVCARLHAVCPAVSVMATKII